MWVRRLGWEGMGRDGKGREGMGWDEWDVWT